MMTAVGGEHDLQGFRGKVEALQEERMTRCSGRIHVSILLLTALLLAAATAAACSASDSAGASETDPSGTQAASGSQGEDGADDTGGGTDGGEAPDGRGEEDDAEDSAVDAGAPDAKGASGADMRRVIHALGYMRAVASAKPVVVLLGGSAAREATISDGSWRREIEANGGPATLAWNMGSSNRTMAENVAIVEHLPRAAQAIVFIGINLGSFTSTDGTASFPTATPPTSPPSLQQPHRYSVKTGVLTTGKKRTLLRKWMTDRYPVYKRAFKSSAAVLEQLIRLCLERGYQPVLLELPRNVAVIADSMEAPTQKYRMTCKALAAEYGIPWVSFVSRAKLPDSAFYDLWHLVEPGREVWQSLLSAETAALLSGQESDGGS